jgi:hydroxyethylthiazole kinase-like sugar kinase family protein
MPIPEYIEGRLASLADVSGKITIDEILTNNSVLFTGEVTSVSQDTETTIVTAPSNGEKYLTKIICTGVVNARWDVYIDSVIRMTKRTTDRTVDFDFSTPLKIAAASVVDVKATHHGPDTTADFQACIIGYQEVP